MPKRAKRTRTTEAPDISQPVAIPMDELRERPFLVRSITQQSVNNMMEILRRSGQVQSILINPTKTIIDGHVRYRAAKSLKWTKIKCLVIDLPPDREEMLVMALANIGPSTSEWDEDRLVEELYHMKNAGALPSATPAALKKKLKTKPEATCVRPTKFKLTVLCESEDEQRDAFEFALKRKWNPRVSGK